MLITEADPSVLLLKELIFSSITLDLLSDSYQVHIKYRYSKCRRDHASHSATVLHAPHYLYDTTYHHYCRP